MLEAAALAAKFLAKQLLKNPKTRGPIIAGGAIAVAMVGLLVFSLIGGIIAGVAGGGGGGASDTSTSDSCGNSLGPSVTGGIGDIPAMAVDAYQKAGQATGLDWTMIAGIGEEESHHGQGHLQPNGDVNPPIYGPPTKYGTAEGPMQFLPSTFSSYGKDGNGDGVINIQNIYDAAMGTAYMMKANGAPGDWKKAIFAYNHANWYVDDVTGYAAHYRELAAVAAEGGNAADMPTPTTTDVASAPTTDANGAVSAPAAACCSVNGTAADGATAATDAASPAAAVGTPAATPAPGTTVNVTTNTGCSALNISVTPGGWANPNPGARLSSGFGYRGATGASEAEFHKGQDLAAPCGTPIYAAHAGTITRAGPASGFGDAIYEDIGGGISLWYGHEFPSGLLVVEGEQVVAGQVIGLVGSNGQSTGCHDHYQVNINVSPSNPLGTAIDPVPFMQQMGAPLG